MRLVPACYLSFFLEIPGSLYPTHIYALKNGLWSKNSEPRHFFFLQMPDAVKDSRLQFPKIFSLLQTFLAHLRETKKDEGLLGPFALKTSGLTDLKIN